MKRLINYIRNLFGADEKLRKWCVEYAHNIAKWETRYPPTDEVSKYAKSLYEWVKTGQF